MECKGVKMAGRHIACIAVNPARSLPGFLELWLNKDERRIINGIYITEIDVEADGAPDINSSITTILK